MTVPQIFDRTARRLQRRRAAQKGFFNETMSNDLLERLDDVKRDFTSALIVGGGPVLSRGLKARGIEAVIADPVAVDDRIEVKEASFDLVVSSGSLDTISDLPGMLLLLRRALKPDGLFLANFAGAPTLVALRQAVATADMKSGRAAARFHPQIDVRSAGDLLVRAGFALAVADLDTLCVTYRSVLRLIDDLRQAGATNVLAERHGVSRSWLASLDDAFAALADASGRTHETVSFITLTGWAPSPDQPKPAARGSGKASLASALGNRPTAVRSQP